MQKPRVFIYMHYMEIGGAERALLGLLHAIDPNKVDIDLFLNQHTGELLPLIPEHVRLLPQLPEYSAIERPIKTIVKEGHIGIALRRLIARRRHRKYSRSLTPEQRRIDDSIFQYIFRAVTPALRSLEYLGEYNLAISFLHPHNIVLQKVKAKRKVCWIHTDYATVHVNHGLELPIWSGFDAIASISEESSKAFVSVFPSLEPKVFVFENILPATFIRHQALISDVSDEMPCTPDSINILSIGRYSVQKRFYDVPRMCRIMLDKGLKFKWYIIGFGPDEEIRQGIDKYNVQDTLILLGKKDNPYPYIAACDIYAQPSLYEGKSVTVREAQILGRPVVIADYPSARSQVTDGIDGRIAPFDTDGCACGIYEFAMDRSLREQMSKHLLANDFSASDAIEQFYNLIPRVE